MLKREDQHVHDGECKDTLKEELDEIKEKTIVKIKKNEETTKRKRQEALKHTITATWSSVIDDEIIKASDKRTKSKTAKKNKNNKKRNEKKKNEAKKACLKSVILTPKTEVPAPRPKTNEYGQVLYGILSEKEQQRKQQQLEQNREREAQKPHPQKQEEQPGTAQQTLQHQVQQQRHTTSKRGRSNKSSHTSTSTTRSRITMEDYKNKKKQNISKRGRQHSYNTGIGNRNSTTHGPTNSHDPTTVHDTTPVTNPNTWEGSYWTKWEIDTIMKGKVHGDNVATINKPRYRLITDFYNSPEIKGIGATMVRQARRIMIQMIMAAKKRGDVIKIAEETMKKASKLESRLDVMMRTELQRRRKNRIISRGPEYQRVRRSNILFIRTFGVKIKKAMEQINENPRPSLYDIADQMALMEKLGDIGSQAS